MFANKWIKCLYISKEYLQIIKQCLQMSKEWYQDKYLESYKNKSEKEKRTSEAPFAKKKKKQ